MRKEHRNNLIFIIVLLALSAPGVMILVQRKLQKPPGDQMGFSAPVRLEVPYVNPLPVGSETRLTFPPRLRAWIQTLSPTAPARAADISQHRSFELIDRAGGGDEAVLTLLVWDPRVDVREARFTLGEVEPRETSIDQVEVPAAVQSELRLLGYLAPPQQVPRVKLVFSQSAAGEALRLRGTRDGSPFFDSLSLPIERHGPRS